MASDRQGPDDDDTADQNFSNASSMPCVVYWVLRCVLHGSYRFVNPGLAAPSMQSLAPFAVFSDGWGTLCAPHAGCGE